ncbi:MAG: TetR family transcriptional regulator [Alphaproteobacteria bacterium]|nr:TetR family transcriptional regulator [Alphaproteobacteria bacterium]
MTMKPADDLRRSVLDASLALIAERGLAGLSMREAARRAGVSHQAPYHHFGDREGILAAIVGEGFVELAADCRAAIEGIDDPIARLEACGQAYIRFAMRRPAHFKLMFRSEHVSAPRHDEIMAKGESAFDLLIRTAHDAAVGGIGEADDALAITSWGLAHGIATLLIEGKLEKKCGDDPRAQLAAAMQALSTFSAMQRAARKKV